MDAARQQCAARGPNEKLRHPGRQSADQISQLAEQIQNQLKIYENMLQNTAQLPDHVWGQVESDLNQVLSIVDQGQGIAFSMGNADDVLQQRFQSYADLKNGLSRSHR
jgi:P-type conjugative transfer protein TrbJ